MEITSSLPFFWKIWFLNSQIFCEKMVFICIKSRQYYLSHYHMIILYFSVYQIKKLRSSWYSRCISSRFLFPDIRSKEANPVSQKALLGPNFKADLIPNRQSFIHRIVLLCVRCLKDYGFLKNFDWKWFRLELVKKERHKNSQNCCVTLTPWRQETHSNYFSDGACYLCFN